MSNNTWPTSMLGDERVAVISSGGTPSRLRPEYFGGAIRWVKSGDLKDRPLSTTEETISEEGLENSSAKVLQPNTVLIAMYGATVGKTALLKAEAATNQAVCAIQPNPEVFNSHFLQFMLMDIRPQLLRERYGGAQPNISQTIIRNLELPRPERAEQDKIAAVLWKVQRAIEVEEKLIATARELKQSAMRQLFTCGLRGEPQKETDVGPIPESWPLVPASEIFKLTSGRKRPSDLSPVKTPEGPFPVLGGNGVMGYSAQWFLDTDECLVIGRVGEYCGVVHLARGKGWITDNALYAKEWLRDDIRVDYLAEFLHYFDLNRFKRIAGQPLVTQGLINEHSFPAPAPDEQREIALILQTIDRKISVHERKRATLQELFKTVLHQLMTGQTRVDKLDIDVSEVADASFLP